MRVIEIARAPIVACAVLLVLALPARRSCRLTQDWLVGDAYSWETIDFHRDGTGVWIEGDRHGEERRQEFRWRREGWTLHLTAGSQQRDVTYSIGQDRRACILHFDAPPLANASTVFYGSC